MMVISIILSIFAEIFDISKESEAFLWVVEMKKIKRK